MKSENENEFGGLVEGHEAELLRTGFSESERKDHIENMKPEGPIRKVVVGLVDSVSKNVREARDGQFPVSVLADVRAKLGGSPDRALSSGFTSREEKELKSKMKPEGVIKKIIRGLSGDKE